MRKHVRQKCKCLNVDAYAHFHDVVCDYVDIFGCANEDRLYSILALIKLVIIDFNNELQRWNDENGISSVDWFRCRVYDVDVLLSAVVCLRDLLGINSESKDVRIHINDKIAALNFGIDATAVSDFRYLRGLLLAHPFDMDRGDDTVYLEDVFPGIPVPNVVRLWAGCKHIGIFDFIFYLSGKGNRAADFRFVNFGRDVVRIGHIAMRAFDVLRQAMNEKMISRIIHLRSKPIVCNHDSTISYLASLKSEFKNRYPQFISDDADADRCFLDDAVRILLFCDQYQKNDFLVYYCNHVYDAVVKFEKLLQDMAFTDCDGYFSYFLECLYPACTYFDGLSLAKSSSYMFGKIKEYLSFADASFSAESAIWKLKHYTYIGCTGLRCVSNSEWAIIQIFEMLNAAKINTVIDFMLSNGEIAIQFWALVFEIERAHGFDMVYEYLNNADKQGGHK